METDRIYMDNAATTRTAPEVVEAMLPYFTDTYAVASSQFSHTPGILAKDGLDKARETLAIRLHAAPDEIVFTSGGTESNNLALKGTALAFRGKKNRIVTSKIEHTSVLHSCQWLEKEGVQVSYVGVDSEGFVDLDQLKDAVREDTFLVSIQHGNQEVGTIQDIGTIASLCREKGVLFHVDAALSFTHEDIDLGSLPADLVTVSAHKIHGPKGVGALFVRKGTPLVKTSHGGYHEFDLRAGTENVAGVVGFGRAVDLADGLQGEGLRALQRSLMEGLTTRVEGAKINGPLDQAKRLPNNVNVSFEYIEGESVVLHLDMKGISVITGSACFSRSLEPSHVMMALGFSHERAHGSIRYTLSRYNRPDEINRVVDACKEVVEALRKISPLVKKE
jgi:cysteine desulfurase